MADGCGSGFYRDRKTGKCVKSITTHPSRRGTYGKGFLSEPQQEEYARINQVEKRESPELVVEQTAAMNSWTAHDKKGKEHQRAHADLEYAEKLAHKDPKKDPRPDPPSGSSSLAWDRENYNYDVSHGNQSGAEWALERERYEASKAGSRKEVRNRMASEKCGPGEEYVAPYRKDDGTEVAGYCRKATDRITPHDRRVDSENGKKARGSTWRKRK